MSTIALPFDESQVVFHETMAAVLRAQQTIRRQAGRIGLVWSFWDVASDLKHLIRLHANLQRSMLKVRGDGFPDDMLATSIASTAHLVEAVHGLLDTAKRAGLTNRTLTAGSLQVIGQRTDKIAEYLEMLRLSVDPEVARLVEEGRRDFVEGRGVGLDSLLAE